MRRRDGFTLLELLVAMALSAILVAVLATTFGYVTRAQAQSLARLDAVRDVSAAFATLEGDWARAVAAPQAPTGFEVALADPQVTVDLDGAPRTLRHDTLEVLDLEPCDPDGDGVLDTTRLVRTRYLVRWDAAREEGALVRVRSPATIPGLSLPTLGAAETGETVVLSHVIEVRVQPWIDERYRDPPAVADLADFRARFVYSGQLASLVAFDLRTTESMFDHVGPGCVVRLEDATGRARFDQGDYAVRLRQLVPGPAPADPVEARLVLARPPGDAQGDVRYTATWLPSALFVTLDVKVGDSRELSIRRTGKVIVRRAADAALIGGGP